MSPFKDVEHQFSLKGMKAGDEFLGCERCWVQYPAFQRPVKMACVAQCRRCGGKMDIFIVTQKDVDEGLTQ